jgi:hypothetical protein
MSCLRYVILGWSVVRARHAWFIAIDYRSAELNYSLNDLIGRLQNHEFLAAGHRDYGIWRNLNVFNQVRIQNQRNMVDASQPDHGNA